MFVDPITTPLPETLDPERFIIATYYAAGRPGTNMMKFGAALAVEQTTGTWLTVPGETPEVRERAIGRVIGVYEAPAYQAFLPKEVEERHFIIRIAYPWKNFGPQITMMLSTVIGNIASSGKLKLLDLEFPESFTNQFKGPKFGVPGLRDLLGVHDRPLLNNMIKPCIGLDPQETAKLAYEAARGGVDIIKDDELVGNPEFCPIIDRIKAVQEALKKADDEKGEKTLFVYNITDRPDRIRENALRAIDAGAEALMLNYFPLGFDATRIVTEDPDINVPILGHSDFTGAAYESPWSGMSMSLIGAKIPRLCGLDMMIALTPFGKFPVMSDVFMQGGLQMLAPWGHIKPMMPMPGGGTTQGHVQELIETFGIDVMVAAGGAIHGHPMGPAAGAKAFRQAFDVVLGGGSIYGDISGYPELQAAVDAWGLPQVKKAGVYDLLN
jgi:2,3-diketo-5-methylthiopentyl-1-phosphate enolase